MKYRTREEQKMFNTKWKYLGKYGVQFQIACMGILDYIGDKIEKKRSHIGKFRIMAADKKNANNLIRTAFR